MTLAEVAEQLNRSEATLRYWVSRGEGPKSFKLGRRRVFRAETVDSWLAEQEAKSDELAATKTA
jgi:excisionase family DNA binding protein